MSQGSFKGSRPKESFRRRAPSHPCALSRARSGVGRCPDNGTWPLNPPGKRPPGPKRVPTATRRAHSSQRPSRPRDEPAPYAPSPRRAGRLRRPPSRSGADPGAPAAAGGPPDRRQHVGQIALARGGRRVNAGVRPWIAAPVDTVQHERVIMKIRVHAPTRARDDGDGPRPPSGHALVPGLSPQPAEHRAQEQRQDRARQRGVEARPVPYGHRQGQRPMAARVCGAARDRPDAPPFPPCGDRRSWGRSPASFRTTR